MATNTVILVPGFLGSTLTESFLGLGSLNIWLSPSRLVSGSFLKLQLPVEGEPAPPYGVNTLDPGKALSYYYGLICGYLLLRGWNVYTVNADFRRPIAHDAGLLAAAIINLSAGGPVQLVCHSRGGLVARAAIGQLLASGRPGLVSRVIALGTPHTGSLQAAINMACWGAPKALLTGLGLHLPGTANRFIGLDQVNAVLRSWPALYELLPPPTAPWLPPATAAALYLAPTYTGSSLDPVQSLMTAALAAWAAMPPKPAGVDWVDVAGLGLDTPCGVPDLSQITVPGSVSFECDGDGTVILASAHTGTSRLITTPCNHDLLPQDGRLWPYIHQALSGGLNADVAIGGRVLTI